MTPEQQVISRELAAELNAADVPQNDSLWLWWCDTINDPTRAEHWRVIPRGQYWFGHYYAAFTQAELIARLGDEFHALERAAVGFNAHGHGIGVVAPTSEDALGQLLLEVLTERYDG